MSISKFKKRTGTSVAYGQYGAGGTFGPHWGGSVCRCPTGSEAAPPPGSVIPVEGTAEPVWDWMTAKVKAPAF